MTPQSSISIAPRGASLNLPVASDGAAPVSTNPPVAIAPQDGAPTLSGDLEDLLPLTSGAAGMQPTEVQEETPEVEDSQSGLDQQSPQDENPAGGGGIEQQDVSVSPAPTEFDNSQGSNVAVSGGNEDAACDIEQDRSFEARVIALINAERQRNGLGSLVEQSQITAAAREHSSDMACNGFFDHVSPKTDTVIQRVESLGYEYSVIAENIAAGYATPEEVFQAWMNSNAHREYILDPAYTQVGIGYVYLSGSEYGNYWTAVYSSP